MSTKNNKVSKNSVISKFLLYQAICVLSFITIAIVKQISMGKGEGEVYTILLCFRSLQYTVNVNV